MSDWPEPAVDYVQAITDTKLVLGHRYAQWALSGPSLEDDIGGASAAQEEIGHVRQLASKLEGQGRDLEWTKGQRDPDEFANAACLDRIEGDWTEYVASVAPADRAAWYLLDAIDRDELEGLITKMGEDEYFHLEYHDARLETLAEEDPETVQATLERTLPQALAFIGPAAYDESEDPLYEAGFTDRPISEIRRSFADHYRELFADTAVSLEDVDWDGPALGDWNETRRRTGADAIAADDVEQLRGERNAEFALS
ncbi:Phenylacetic acid catabolic protein [Natronococcus sp. A-GB7]|uniref:Phenylacetic acid catabolic protein n=1 Tax=Natronococcus sp. A-GB7 TaxID=3037649 RepID=UPI00241EB6EC|nr:Phenylacetic acid catabolic protein [Natronococcus sp. A-GB7]MDG5817647.1 phenylacetate-CoA oxygenase subunit PaaI [Natronococcus sp. A-GB7]